MASTPEDGGGGLPQLDFDTWPSQILWLIVTITALYFILTRIALPKIEETITERAEAINRDLERAEEFNRKAEETVDAYETKLAKARDEARRVSEAAKGEAAAQLREALAEADEKIAARFAESEKRIEAIRDEAADKAKEVATATAEALAARFAPGGAVDGATLSSAVSARIQTLFGGR